MPDVPVVRIKLTPIVARALAARRPDLSPGEGPDADLTKEERLAKWRATAKEVLRDIVQSHVDKFRDRQALEKDRREREKVTPDVE